MKNFDLIQFKGQFRSYQQRVLDQADLYLKDKKIHIVAAPGSGKTILGLELIRRLGKSSIIFSPTITIKDQWVERFKESFLPDKEDVVEYVSTDLNQIKLLNSVTYQALYSVMNKIKTNTPDETIDYSSIDLFQILAANEIKTICLDEAHHLQNEWQKALEKFIKNLPKDITVISLTATPPYDAKTAEWNRYISICGAIDDEIFVPELIKEGTLCPHQDYIFFNYPQKKEAESFKGFKEDVFSALKEISTLPFLKNCNGLLKKLYESDTSYLYEHFQSVVALYIFLSAFGYTIDKYIFYRLTFSKGIPALNLVYAQRSIEFILEWEAICEKDKFLIIELLKKYNIYERNKPCFELKESLKRSLISSAGKLQSITRIVQNESLNLKEDLRLLVLTDYIKKEALQDIGKKTMSHISLVSIFEELRRTTNIKIGCLSGSLVILPISILKKMEALGLDENKYSANQIQDIPYAQITFKGNNKQKISIISKLFEQGDIQVLIGTQALLGEGWDSPCINSLILASYVGSFMLSNQMRGRAIRSYKLNPNKTANIWHLVTLEPDYLFEDDFIQRILARLQQDKKEITSYDYKTLTRRFDCFLGPNYDTLEVESGIDRVTIIQPPFDEANIEKINKEMLKRANQRNEMAQSWHKVVEDSVKIVTESKIPKTYGVPAFTYINFFALITAALIEYCCIQLIVNLIKIGINFEWKLISWLILIIIFFVVGYGMIKLTSFLCKHRSPKQSIEGLSKAILNTFKELDLIQSSAHLKVTSDSLNIGINVCITNATIHEQNIFNKAVEELLSPMENPRYVIIKETHWKKVSYKYSFSCPSFINNKEEAMILKKHLKGIMGNMKVVYVYNEKGRGILLKCKKRSFISKNQAIIERKQKISKFE